MPWSSWSWTFHGPRPLMRARRVAVPLPAAAPRARRTGRTARSQKDRVASHVTGSRIGAHRLFFAFWPFSRKIFTNRPLTKRIAFPDLRSRRHDSWRRVNTSRRHRSWRQTVWSVAELALMWQPARRRKAWRRARRHKLWRRAGFLLFCTNRVQCRAVLYVVLLARSRSVQTLDCTERWPARRLTACEVR